MAEKGGVCALVNTYSCALASSQVLWQTQESQLNQQETDHSEWVELETIECVSVSLCSRQGVGYTTQVPLPLCFLSMWDHSWCSAQSHCLSVLSVPCGTGEVAQTTCRQSGHTGSWRHFLGQGHAAFTGENIQFAQSRCDIHIPETTILTICSKFSTFETCSNRMFRLVLWSSNNLPIPHSNDFILDYLHSHTSHERWILE